MKLEQWLQNCTDIIGEFFALHEICKCVLTLKTPNEPVLTSTLPFWLALWRNTRHLLHQAMFLTKINRVGQRQCARIEEHLQKTIQEISTTASTRSSHTLIHPYLHGSIFGGFLQYQITFLLTTKRTRIRTCYQTIRIRINRSIVLSCSLDWRENHYTTLLGHAMLGSILSG